MKIPVSIRNAYANLVDQYEPLKIRIDRAIGDNRDPRWFYTSRIKELESYAQKLETGRFTPEGIDDFFGCTLVVRNLNDFGLANDLIERVCDVRYRRPRDESKTHKSPDAFPFDDLRVYARYKDDPALPPSGVNELLFEIQIKTFLQHAWSIATHDLIYKTDEVSWAKSRIAFQIKAMLEHAEISIDEAERLSATRQLAKSDKRTEVMAETIGLLNRLWANEDLPYNRLRLTDTVSSLLRELNLTAVALEEVLQSETTSGRGIKLVNLSPYGIIVQSLLDGKPELVKTLTNQPERKFKLFIPAEVEIPKSFSAAELVNVVRIN